LATKVRRAVRRGALCLFQLRRRPDVARAIFVDEEISVDGRERPRSTPRVASRTHWHYKDAPRKRTAGSGSSVRASSVLACQIGLPMSVQVCIAKRGRLLSRSSSTWSSVPRGASVLACRVGLPDLATAACCHHRARDRRRPGSQPISVDVRERPRSTPRVASRTTRTTCIAPRKRTAGRGSSDRASSVLACHIGLPMSVQVCVAKARPASQPIFVDVELSPTRDRASVLACRVSLPDLATAACCQH
jgi:hypothetical protein